MSLLNVLGAVIAAVGLTQLLNLIGQAVEIGRHARDEAGELDRVPVVAGWYAVSSASPVAMAAAPTATWYRHAAMTLLPWGLALACITLGMAQASDAAVAVGTIAVLLLGWARLRDARFRRHAITAQVRSTHIAGPTYRGSGTAYVEVEDRTLAVTVPWRLCRALVDRRGSVTLLVAYTQGHALGRAYAIGVGAPSALLNAPPAGKPALAPAPPPRSLH